ncbi:SsgA family sporulation/cell division regulator [Streptomyces poonensis]|uniref:Sporulation-specific cell division protein SsgB n=1 Tax=Streptomyces poonensis TaxID=68255 RepID=A0A918PYY9_9ACTN|nr:SsgA family sporulation/cell division regulator [Streptomyces poonensis]GGZ25392.1 sporulation-specific cell division protein SsgB [Streptomyces poonensis]GLJ89132.1 sporulation-specific cell division protein SsgB [Streptomyces poonensis]
MAQPYRPGAADGISVVHEVVVHVVLADEPPVPLPAELRYDSTDPYAVCLSVGPAGSAGSAGSAGASSTGTVDWVFARSLLAEGLTRPAGVGDVLLVPRYRRRPPAVRVIVRSAAGAAALDLAASAVTAFLERTHMVVPPGTEGAHIDLERVVAELVAGSE